MFLIRFDSWLISVFERFSHWFQRFTGRDNFWLAWVLFYTWVIFSIWEMYIANQHSNQTMTFIVMASLLILYMIWQIFLAIMVSSFRSMKLGTSMTRNPLEHIFWVRLLRLYNVTLALWSLSKLLLGKETLGGLSAVSIHTSMWYFFSCTPLPPGESKLTKLVASIASAFSRKAASAGTSA